MNLFKIALPLAVIFSVSLSSSAFALENSAAIDIGDKTANKITGSNTDEILIKTEDSTVVADTLHKGQVILGGVGDGKVIITGQLIVKLIDDVSAKQFADDYDLHLVLTTGTNINVFEPEHNEELVSLLENLRRDNRVVRASLDKSKEQYHTK